MQSISQEGDSSRVSSAHEAEAFFRAKLAGIEEPSAPLGVLDAATERSRIVVARQILQTELAGRIRTQAGQRGVSAATLFHAAWALVVAHTSGREDVVYGTMYPNCLKGSAESVAGAGLNRLPLCLRLGRLTARALVELTQRELLELSDHGQAPLALLERCSDIPAPAPLFSTLLSYRTGTSEIKASEGPTPSTGAGETPYPIVVCIDDQGTGFSLRIETDCRIDPQRMVNYLSSALESVVRALEAQADRPALRLPILPECERHELLEGFNATDAPYPRDKLIHQLFEEQVQRDPHALAVVFEGQSLTYADLNARANQLAHFLRDHGVGPDQPVGLCLERSLEMVIGLLGVLKAGGAYMPLDPTYPAERLSFMLEEAAPRVLLTQHHLRSAVPLTEATLRTAVIALDVEWDRIAQHSSDNLDSHAVGAREHHLAYVIYTSGSTGRPKGVMNEHRGVVNRLQWMQDAYRLGAGDRVLQKTPFGFDVSVWEFFWTLISGARLVVARAEGHKDPGYLCELIQRTGVTRLHFVPSMLQSFLDQPEALECTSLQHIVCSGEELPAGLQKKCLQSLPAVRLSNLYGPTEAAVDVTAWECRTSDPNARVPIGRPISNIRMYVLDRYLQPVPLCVPGEIYIGGVGVARGYLKRPDLTGERFLPDPFASDEHARLYRTGDLGRWRPGGVLEYLGRNDHQVKIRGFRIELGEIEAELTRHAQVKEAVVIAREDVPGEKRLVAYLTANHPNAPPEAHALRAHLQSALPDYMVPSAFVLLEQMPLTSNGKLDRKALPEPQMGAYARQQNEPPRGEIEEAVAEIWQALLHVDRVGRWDNFFELGGHSLLIAQLMERLRRRGWSAQIQRVFESPTLAQLASALRREARQYEVPPNRIPLGCEVITADMLPLVELDVVHLEAIVKAVPGGAANIQDIYPLAPLQEGILFHHMLDPGRADAYIQTMLLSVSCEARLQELIAALQAVIDRHDVLRTAVLWEQVPRPVQVVWRQARLPVDVLTLDADRDAEEQMKERMVPERQRMDLRQAPLLRLQVAVAPHGMQRYVLLQLHHMICDNETASVLFEEARAHLEKRGTLLESVPYRNHVALTLELARTQDAEAFFRDRLGDVDEPTAPFGLWDVRGDGSQVEEGREALDASLAQQVRAQARRLGVSAAILFHAAWGLVVGRTSGRDDVVFGTVLLGHLQESAGAQRALGMFINTLPLRLRLKEVTARGLVEQTRRELVELLGLEQASLAVAQRCSGVPASMPLFTALLNYRHRPKGAETAWLNASGIQVLAAQTERTNYPIVISIDDLGEAGFALTMQTDRRIDPQRMTAYLNVALGSLMDSLQRQPDRPALQLSILPESERHQVIRGFHARTPYPGGQLIHELFEDRVRRQPQAIAVLCEGDSLTYAELNARANQLAWYLIGKAVAPEELVGICTERSLEMVVGVLAILKAGGAYLPLDPAHPPERLANTLADAAPKIVLIQERLRERVPAPRAEVIALDADWTQIGTRPTGNPRLMPWGLGSDRLAYVIYTSGSTGTPKGVMVEHRNVVRLFAATENGFGFDERDVWVLFHSLAFDFSVWELWGALLYGGSLVVAPYLTTRSPQEFYDLVCKAGVTVLNQTPSAFLQFIDAQAQRPQLQHSLRVVIFGGEALELRTLRPWLERNGVEKPQLVNMYGITETTVHVTYHPITCSEIESERGRVVGRPIPDLHIYLLDPQGQPVPIGVPGEIYVGGAGVSRGYLNRPELTAERFIAEPFDVDEPARLYKTGDLGKWRADGTIEYLGRNDHQVKVRGFRIELGEIQAQLLRHSQVSGAVVLAEEDTSGERRLVAYVIPRDAQAPPSTEQLRSHLLGVLPEYMVPSAFVQMQTLPLTPSGKFDRRALPAPDARAYMSRRYAAPQGEVEEILAGIWQELLHVERVGRWDNFFELGGHSLLIVRLMQRLRRLGLTAQLRRVLDNPTLADLAGVLTRGTLEQFEVPESRIPVGCQAITPQMLPLADLDADHIGQIARLVPGGAANIQDIYPLAPLQEGILFHHLFDGRGDAYVLQTVLSVSSRARVDELVAALRAVIARHDVLRTAVLWERLPRPVQVVYRQVSLPVEEIALDPGRAPMEQIQEWLQPRRQRLDLRQAPLLRLRLAADPHGAGWYVLLQSHHIVEDATSLAVMISEVVAHLENRADTLPASVPYRNHVAQALAYARNHDAETFFRTKLGTIEEPTAPFGLLDVHGDGSRTEESLQQLAPDIARRLRAQARRLGVSSATLFHAAWALVVARTSGRDDVVFGTVLLGRMQGSAGAQRILGMFINTLPLRLPLQHMTVKEFVERAQRELVELLSHEQASLAVAQRCSGVAGSVPLFSTLLNYRHSDLQTQSGWADTTGIRELVAQERTNYPIAVFVDDLGEGFTVTVQTDRRVDPRRIVQFACTAAEAVTVALEEAPHTPIQSLSILPQAERRQVIEVFNATRMAYPQEKLIHELFEEQVQRIPGALAVAFEGEALTYAELNAKANQLARYLMARQVGPDQLVGICLERGPEMVVGLLGILKAGGAYVPLDPNYPPDRLQHVLQDSRPTVLLCQERLRGRFPASSTNLICLDSDSRQITLESSSNPDARALGLRSDHLAYVIYTSGSTGQPKGVAIEHRNAVNLIVWAQTAMAPELLRRTLQSTSLSFDLSVFECFVPLTSGASIEVVVDAMQMLRSRLDVTLINTVPSAIRAIVDAGRIPQTARGVNLAGEALERDVVESIFQRSDVEYVCNLYGPSETTTYSTWIAMSREGGFIPTIGRPIANTRIYILDACRLPVPIGVAGEIYIGGAGVARGYLNRPELTAERFVEDPFCADPKGRMYRTGDLGRWRVEGDIEYLGRNDQQVKIRGFRIELGEIEAQLGRREDVKEVVVLAREDVPGEKRLVAYVVPRLTSAAPGVEELRTYLVGMLPEYMVPAAFVMLERLPLTPNGKLDRKALPAPELGAYVSRRYEAPRGELEEILAGIWQDLLHVERVGRQDNFFELGGHSLLVVQMLERLRRVGLSAEIRRVFESPALGSLASVLGRGAEEFVVPPSRIPDGCQQITPDMLPLVRLDAEHIERIARAVPGGVPNVQDIYPLAPLQEGLLFHYLLNPEGGDAYARVALFSLSSQERLQRLLQALQAVIDRHDILRTAVLWDQLPCAVQVVCRRAGLPVEAFELQSDRPALEQLEERMQPQRQRLDLRQAPLMRVQVAADPHSAQWYALLQTHHLVCDNGSLGILFAEVMAFVEAREQSLPPPIPYRNHVAQILGQVHTAESEAFFRGKLGDVEEPTAPFGLVDVQGDGSRVEVARQTLPDALGRRIRSQARQLGVSVATVFHAAWGLVLAHTSGREDVVFGSVLLGRLQSSAGAQRILGMFINTLPLRLRLRQSSARELVEQTQRELIELLVHEQASLSMAQRCSGIAGSTALFSALLNYQHSTPGSQESWTDAPGVRLLASRGMTNYPVVLSVDDTGEGFGLEMETDRRIDPGRMLGFVRTALQSLVQALKEAPQTAVLSLSILPQIEREQVTKLFNATRDICPREDLIHRLFEEQVERSPDAIAVTCGDHSLTYSVLNAKANQVARSLRRRGVGPDELVGLCAEPSVGMVVGLLGILKAGGAYVPLDPGDPPERLAWLLKDSGSAIALVQEHLRDRLPGTRAVGDAEVIVLDQWSGLALESVGNLDAKTLGVCSDLLAYVVYTSDPSGNPKGVMVEHRNVVGLLAATEEGLGFNGLDVGTLFHPLASDLSVWELWGSLLYGGRLVVVPPLTVRSTRKFYSLVCKEQVTALSQAPSEFAKFIDAQAQDGEWHHSLRVVIFGGEALELTALWPWVERNGAETPQLMNMYGTTETTGYVTSHAISSAQIDSERGSVVGKPLPGLRTYLLGPHGQPVPIGVTGEIYVGGRGVARGYLKRPELTAQRLIADPFSADKQARLYKTGDLGRWRMDGTIEYLGRYDRQVKIQGVRVELEEIEAQLARHEDLEETAVLLREDFPGEKRLVAYVVPRVSQGAPGVEALRKHLLRVLPQSVVPAVFVMLERFPLTPSGKVDRKALPAPELEGRLDKSYAAPASDVEKTLIEIWESLFDTRPIGVHDDFFRLGGHSLLGLKMMSRVKAVLSVELSIRTLFEVPTVRQLAERVMALRGGRALGPGVNGSTRVEDPLIDLSQESALDPRIVPGVPACPVPRAILLTGATGFVGRFLLAQLLEQTDAPVYCLVRAASQQQASLRLKATLLKWDLWRDEWAQRAIAVPGDLRQPRVGLDEPTYEMLARTVDTIYHCGASMNHLETYTRAKAANVGAAAELLRLAVYSRLKLVNYISTSAVFSEATGDGPRVVYEHSSIDREQHRNSQGYAASKWVAEKVFLTAGERGIPCNVFRLGLIWADSLQGRYDEAQRGDRLVESCLLAGYGISGYSFDMPLTPVDYAARAVVLLANRYPEGRGIFHICASGLLGNVFERCNEILEMPLMLVPMYDWVQVIKGLHKAGNPLPIAPLIEFAFSMDAAFFQEYERRNLSACVRFDCARTQQELEQAGLVMPEANGDLLRTYVQRLQARHQHSRRLGSTGIAGTGRWPGGEARSLDRQVPMMPFGHPGEPLRPL